MKMKEAVKTRYSGYIDHFQGEIPIYISPENKPYVLPYLEEVRKRSDQAYRQHKSTLKEFFAYIDKPVYSVTVFDIRDFFNDVINQKPTELASKNTRRSYLKSFFNYVSKLRLSEGIDFHNPVPENSVYSFKRTSKDIIKHKEQQQKKIPIDILGKILDYVKKNETVSRNKRNFIICGLGLCTGARISEILSIKRENIDFEERFLETGFEKNARKSTRIRNKALLFFFPETFGTYLKNYIYKNLKKDEEWLFPSCSKTGHVTQYGPVIQRIRTKIGYHFTFHYFRHSLISYLDDNGCPDYKQEILLNHSPTGTQASTYRHKSLATRRSDYDLYFPFKNIKYFY